VRHAVSSVSDLTPRVRNTVAAAAVVVAVALTLAEASVASGSAEARAELTTIGGARTVADVGFSELGSRTVYVVGVEAAPWRGELRVVLRAGTCTRVRRPWRIFAHVDVSVKGEGAEFGTLHPRRSVSSLLASPHAVWLVSEHGKPVACGVLRRVE
jgi:hypothetical protein